MAVWTKAMGSGSLLTAKMYRQQLADPVLVPVDLSLGHGPVKWGLGPIIVGSFVGHQGGVPGYETASYYSPLYHTTIVITTNLQYNTIPPNQFMQAVAETVLGSDIGLPLTLKQAMTPLSAAEMHQITTGKVEEPTQ
jgi:hypothetical protein